MKKLLILPLVLALAISCGDSKNTETKSKVQTEVSSEKEITVTLMNYFKGNESMEYNTKKVVYYLNGLDMKQEDKMRILKDALRRIGMDDKQSKVVYLKVREKLN